MLVFVYGTLTDPERVAALLGAWSDEGAAVLVGLHRVEGEYPTLAPGGRVEGRLLATDEVDRLDAYEGVDRGLYVRVSVPVRGGARPGIGGATAEAGRATEAAGPATADVYVGDPDRLGARADWPGEGGFEGRVAAYVADADVRVEPLRDRQD